MPADWIRGIWRLIQPVRYTQGLRRFGLPGKYARFVGDWKRFRRQGGAAPFCELSPALHDRDPGTQSGGGHYFYQDIWALRKLAQARPAHHNDVGSRFDGFVGQVTAICPVTCWDIRPPSFTLPDFEFRQGSILAMPLPDQSLDSLSCLHTAEHIGLGRYGDPLDPNGTEKALRELARILAPGGRLLFSMPVGRERTEFNAQRIWHPQRPIATVPELQLVEFSAVDDTQKFLANVLPDSVAGARYACGLYEFRRPA